MITSKFILTILDLILDTSEQEELLRQQIPFLSVTEDVEYTGVGAFYGFTSGIVIDNPNPGSYSLDGLKISSPELQSEAEAILHITDGMISYLEIWSLGGDYPKTELTKYKLVQAWKGSPGKCIEVS